MKTHIHLLIVWFLLSCSTNQKPNNEPVGLNFEVTGTTEAILSFQKGLLLLHNFEYDDAAEAFREAQRIDSNFVMAYWGEAMTYNHPVWGDLDIIKARETLQKLGVDDKVRVEKAKSDLEKDFIRSIQILYGGGSKPDRDIAYSDFMAGVYERFPQSQEAGTFYALSILGANPGWDKNDNSKAASIAQSVLKDNPTHPGALHYLIHSDDHPEYAQLALNAANDYAKVASYSGHALHMPSHIYLALGMWNDVVRANEISWQAEADRTARKKLTNDDLGYHSHLWLAYGYLQQGRFDKAKQLLQNQIRYTTELNSPFARFTLQQMKGHYLMETNNWSDSLANISIETKDLTFEIRSIGRLIEGTKYFHLKNKKGLGEVVSEMEKDFERCERQKKENGDITICGVTPLLDAIPTEREFKNGKIIRMELEGMTSWLNGDLESAEKWLRAAAALEVRFLVGPPDLIKPSHELLGEFLLSINKPKEAFEQFKIALTFAPNRVLSLKGQLEASRQLKDSEQIDELEIKLRNILKIGEQTSI